MVYRSRLKITYHVLSALADYGELKISELGRKGGMAQARVEELLQQLIKRELIIERRDEHFRWFKLTTDGLALKKAMDSWQYVLDRWSMSF